MTVPIVLGLTGSIGAGKSAALASFRRQGCSVLSSDQVVHDLFQDEEVKAKLAERWGAAVVSDAGGIDRNAVAERVFADTSERIWLEQYLWPLVGREINDWIANLRSGNEKGVHIGVVEVPLLFEAEMESAFEFTVTVIADEEIRNQRAHERGQVAVDEREQRQLTQSEKVSRSNFVVNNNGSLESLDAEIAQLLNKLS